MSSTNKKMFYIITSLIILILLGLIYFKKRDTVTQGNNMPNSTLSKTEHFESPNSKLVFGFDYPIYDAWETSVEGDTIHYHFNPPELSPNQYPDMTTDMYIKWQEIAIKVGADFWDNKKINSKGIPYFSSSDKETGKVTVIFRLENQGKSVEFTFDSFLDDSAETLLLSTFVGDKN